jgi:hypothetical protein
MCVHGKTRPDEHDEARRCDGPCPIGVHLRLNFLASLRRRPRAFKRRGIRPPRKHAPDGPARPAPIASIPTDWRQHPMHLYAALESHRHSAGASGCATRHAASVTEASLLSEHCQDKPLQADPARRQHCAVVQAKPHAPIHAAFRQDPCQAGNTPCQAEQHPMPSGQLPAGRRPPSRAQRI